LAFIIGFSQDFILPGTFIKTSFAQGPSLAGSGFRDELFVMPRSTAGTWQVNQIRQVKSVAEAVGGAAEGSPLHRAIEARFKASKKGRVYVLPYLPTSGAGAVVADGYIDINGTATSQGSILISVAGESLVVGYPNGSTATAIGELVEARLNALTSLPCTSNNDAGEVKLTAKIAGASQNAVIRFRASIASGTGVSVVLSGETLGTGFGVVGAEGATTEQVNFAAALAIVTDRKYYIVSYLATTAALASLKLKLVDDADFLVGKRQVGIAATVEAHTAAITKSVALNYERLSLVNEPSSEHTPEVLAAQYSALKAVKENADSRSCFSGFRGDADVNWILIPVEDQNDKLDSDDLNDCLINGVTPIASDAVGSYLVKSVTTRSKAPNGATNDRRALEPHRVSVIDDFADSLANKHNATYVAQGYILTNDVKDSDGNIDSLAKYPAKTVTPDRWKSLPLQLIKEFGLAGKIKNVAVAVASCECQISATNPARLENGQSLEVVDPFDQVSVNIDEVSAG